MAAMLPFCLVGPFCSVVRADDLEHFTHGGIVAVSKAAQRNIARHVKPAIHDTVVAQMHADDFAETDKIRFALYLDDLGHAAFKRGRSIRHPRAGDLVTIRFLDACMCEFVGAMGQGGGGFVEIQPMGRGVTMALNGLCGRPWPSAGR